MHLGSGSQPAGFSPEKGAEKNGENKGKKGAIFLY
jgi:hypothetical protein